LSVAVKELKPTRPVLRYHGGKFRLGPWVVSNLPPHKRYTEAYAGAASVLMHKPRVYAEVVNDLDGEICSLFRVLRDPAQSRELKRLLVLTPFARSEFELSYLPAQDPIEQARRTIARSFMGFGSAAASGQDTGFRNDASRSYTTPATDWANYPDALDFFTQRLRGVVVENMPALQLLEKFDGPDTLHYQDPTYLPETRSQKRRQGHCYRYEMTVKEHGQLAEFNHASRSMVVISGYASDLYDLELYPDWHRIERQTFADGARPRVEVLWLNVSAHDALKSGSAQQSMFEVPANVETASL
jgi:DNA adenine methylase